jgi:hypothetical protein
VILAWRNLLASALQLAAPVLSLAFIAVVISASERGILPDPNSTQYTPSGALPRVVSYIPDCETDIFLDAECVAFVYAPANDSAVDAIVAGIRNHNAPPIREDQVGPSQ